MQNHPCLFDNQQHKELISNAEVDYLLQKGDRIVPVEVKSGKKGAMKSLGMLMDEKSLPLGLRFSQENLSDCGRVRVLPLYLAGEWARFSIFMLDSSFHSC